MSGRPHKYTENEAIMHIMTRKGGNLMWDGTDIYYGPYSRTDEWLDRICKIDSDGMYLTFIRDGKKHGNAIKGWPTKEEIQAEIDRSQALEEKYANHPNAMSINDFIGAAEMLNGYEAIKKPE